MVAAKAQGVAEVLHEQGHGLPVVDREEADRCKAVGKRYLLRARVGETVVGKADV